MQETPARPGHAVEAGHGHGVPLAYQYPVVSGTVPVARWAFASAAVGSFLYVYGGVGPSVLDDLAVLDGALMIWRSLAPTAARPKDRPDKLHAAAMCSLGNSLWLFGGQQGRKHLRSLYSLNTEMLSWRLVTPAGACPAGREGHSFTSVNGQLAYLFGGQGKKLYNDFFVLRQGGSEWVELKARGSAPAPRSGHSMVWDGQDSLVCFGGTTASNTDNSMFVYSLSRNEWSAPECSGTIPSPRTHHSAVLVAPRTMLVFGGCNASGVFFNDAYVLNLERMHWSRAQPLNTAPPPRYHHCCHMLGSRVAMYGGINPKQAFDAVVLLETNFGGELSAVAEELARMTGGSGSAATAAAAGSMLGMNRAAAAAAAASAASSTAAGLAAAAGAVGGSVPLVGDLMKLQLRDLLVKRNMEELHITAQQKAEAAEAKLKEESAAKLALQKEVLQLKLISAESEQAGQALREQLAEVSKALAREQAEHQATSAAVTDLRTSLVSREQQLAEARQLLDSMSAELGILSSRYHRLQQERDALRLARRHQQQLQQQQQQQASSQSPSVEPLTGAAAAAAQLQQRLLLSGGSIGIALDADVDSGSSRVLLAQASRAAAGLERSNSQPSADLLLRSQEQLQLAGQLPSSPAAAAAAAAGQPVAVSELSSRSQSAAGSSRDGASPVELPAAAAAAGLVSGLQPYDAVSHDEPVRLCEHSQLEAACLLCICQRFLAATAGSCSHLAAAGGSKGALLSTSNSAGALPAPASPGSSSSNAMPSAAGLATVAVAACASEAVQYRQFLSISELARNRLEAENAGLQQQAADLQRQVDQQQQQLRVLQANPAALSACSIQELTALEGTLETSTKAVRQVVLQRSIAEYQAQANAESQRCAVCMEAPRRLAFQCGHQTCHNCGDKITACPFCRQDITAKIRLFE